ncbi:MAG: hypothetical protein V7604_2015 [Hyphomicrobiales bacterium]|jgi:CRP-like cAMP-binding protein
MNITDRLIRKLLTSSKLANADVVAIQDLPIYLRDLERDHPIVREGDRTDHSCLLVEGFACRSKTTDEGKRQILSIHIPTEIPDLQTVHLRVMDHDLTALSRCTVGFIPHDAIRALAHARPAVAAALWRETLIDASIFREWIVNGRRSAPKRMAHLVTELAKRLEAVGLLVGDNFELPMTQLDLADALGLTPVHVNRVMQELRKDGLLEFRRFVVTLGDAERLRQLGDFDDLYLHQAPQEEVYAH